MPILLDLPHNKIVSPAVLKKPLNDSDIIINMGMRAVCVETLEDFKALKDDWNKLVEESINPHPFILWEWMFTWWEVYHQVGKDKLSLLALYQEGELVAIAPFYIKSVGPFINSLKLLGEGENKTDAVVTTYPDIIVKESYRKQSISVFSEILKGLTHISLNFNFACFNLVHENSILEALGRCLTDRYKTLKNHSENQFVINLPESEDQYFEGLSKSTRKQFRMKLNRIKKEGDIDITSVVDLKSGLETVEELHRARWHYSEDSNIFDSPYFKRFHNKLSERFQNQDIMQIRVMNHDEKPIAASYNFNYKNTCFSYLGGFKSADDKRFSPMFIFDMLEIKSLIRRRYKRYDLLVSEAQNNYKTKFGSDVNSVYRIHWLKKGFISKGVSAYLNVRPFLSNIYRLFSNKN